jgi:hypothetical protein
VRGAPAHHDRPALKHVRAVHLVRFVIWVPPRATVLFVVANISVMELIIWASGDLLFARRSSGHMLHSSQVRSSAHWTLPSSFIDMKGMIRHLGNEARSQNKMMFSVMHLRWSEERNKARYMFTPRHNKSPTVPLRSACLY